MQPDPDNSTDALISMESTFTPGRFIAGNARGRWVTDARALAGGPGEAVNAGELLLASLGSCALALIQQRSAELSWQLAKVSFQGSFRKNSEDGTRYDFIDLAFTIEGVPPQDAQSLVDHFMSRCPIFNTLLRGGGNISARRQ